jgi:hypothetical protein
MELDLIAQIAGMIAGSKVDLNAGLASGGNVAMIAGGRP